uniref:Phosphoprotein n=1 Tax=Cnidium virus 2 TaxID=3057102 RepID=A0AA96PR01_9RHAB|nr:MAG: phosphoprotein [Cnidium virus 2]
MSNVNRDEFKGVYTPAGEIDYLSMANDDLETVDDIPDKSVQVPTNSDQASDLGKPVSVGDVKKTLENLRAYATAHGAIVDSNMESLFKHYCITEMMDARDVELWIRGYVYSTGSQVGPRITEVTETLKNEVRSLQRTNATLLETIKLLASQAVAVEKEIASVTVNIKSDITAALKSVLEGQAKIYEKSKPVGAVKKLNLSPPDLVPIIEPKKIPETLKAGAPTDPSTSNFSDKSQFMKMRAVMRKVGVDDAILEYLADEDLAVVYPEEDLQEYMNHLDDPDVQQIFREEITKNIEERILS